MGIRSTPRSGFGIDADGLVDVRDDIAVSFEVTAEAGIERGADWWWGVGDHGRILK